MIRFDRIVFPTDFSDCSDHALSYAVFLANRFEGELHMLHALVLHGEDPANPDHRFPEMHALLGRLEEVAHSELGRVAEREELAVLTVRQEQRRGFDPGGVILDYAQEIDAELIVMGTHGRRGARRLLLGSVAEDVLRRSPIPTLFVRQSGDRTHLETLDTLLVPVDFSATSKGVVRWAASLAQSLQARLRLLHVIEIPVLPSVYGQPIPIDMTDLRRRSLDALERLAVETGVAGEGTDFLVSTGLPATEIAAEAERLEAGMIVMPPRSHGRLEHFLAGRTTDLVMRTAPCPVLTTGLRSTVVEDGGEEE
jgi:nucleotide-binding universal stress UspA family protein